MLMEQHHEKMTMNMNQINEGEDRISSLPESLLVSILDRLPIDSAATTSVLSHHWRYLWTQRNSIHFPPCEELDKYNNYEYFVTTVDHIISRISTLKIHEFTLLIPCVGNPKFSSFLLPWISKICSLNLEKFNLEFREVSSKPFQLPSCLFQTQSLSSLKLFAVNFCDFLLPSDGINLPNLKELDVCLHDSHLPNLGAISRSCPLLEYLICALQIKRPLVGEIIAPNLKRLSIYCQGRDLKFVIDTSKLEEIRVVGCLPSFHFVNKPAWLQKANVFVSYWADNDYLREVQGFLQQISCVSSLAFWNSGPCMLSILYGVSFPNLVHLSLHSSHWNALIPFGWLRILKVIEVSGLVGNSLEMKFLEHVLSNAHVLEELHVSIYCNGDKESDHDKFDTRHKFCNDLLLLPKSSLGCQIKLSG